MFWIHLLIIWPIANLLKTRLVILEFRANDFLLSLIIWKLEFDFFQRSSCFSNIKVFKIDWLSLIQQVYLLDNSEASKLERVKNERPPGNLQSNFFPLFSIALETLQSLPELTLEGYHHKFFYHENWPFLKKKSFSSMLLNSTISDLIKIGKALFPVWFFARNQRE